MLKPILFAATAVALLSACSSHVQNPVDRVTFRDQPLVKDVRKGMSEEQVLTLGGKPSSSMTRTVNPGLCHDYILSHNGEKQPYYVSLDSTGHVDGKGFLTCKQMEENERARQL